MQNRTIRRRNFKRIISAKQLNEVEPERIRQIQLNAIDNTRADVVFKQGCLSLKRTVIGEPGEIESLFKRANV